MTVEYIRYTIPQAQHELFVEAYAAAARALDASEHCLAYELTQCEEEPDAFVLRIEWTSTEDHLQNFRTGPHFRAFFPHIRPWVDRIQEMRHYRPTEVVSRRR